MLSPPERRRRRVLSGLNHTTSRGIDCVEIEGTIEKKSVKFLEEQRKRSVITDKIRKEKRGLQQLQRRRRSTNESVSCNLLFHSDYNGLQTGVAMLMSSDDSYTQLSGLQTIRHFISQKNVPVISLSDTSSLVRLVGHFLSQTFPCPNFCIEAKFESLWIISNIAYNNEAGIQAVLNTETASSIISLLSSKVKKIQMQAAWAIGNFATGDGIIADCRNQFYAKGACSALCLCINQTVQQCKTRAYESRTVEMSDMQSDLQSDIQSEQSKGKEDESCLVLRTATWALANLCRNQPSSNRAYLPEMLRAFSLLLSSCADVEVCAQVIWALGYLMEDHSYIGTIANALGRDTLKKICTCVVANTDPQLLLPSLAFIVKLAGVHQGRYFGDLLHQSLVQELSLTFRLYSSRAASIVAITDGTQRYENEIRISICSLLEQITANSNNQECVQLLVATDVLRVLCTQVSAGDSNSVVVAVLRVFQELVRSLNATGRHASSINPRSLYKTGSPPPPVCRPSSDSLSSHCEVERIPCDDLDLDEDIDEDMCDRSGQESWARQHCTSQHQQFDQQFDQQVSAPQYSSSLVDNTDANLSNTLMDDGDGDGDDDKFYSKSGGNEIIPTTYTFSFESPRNEYPYGVRATDQQKRYVFAYLRDIGLASHLSLLLARIVSTAEKECCVDKILLVLNILAAIFEDLCVGTPAQSSTVLSTEQQQICVAMIDRFGGYAAILALADHPNKSVFDAAMAIYDAYLDVNSVGKERVLSMRAVFEKSMSSVSHYSLDSASTLYAPTPSISIAPTHVPIHVPAHVPALGFRASQASGLRSDLRVDVSTSAWFSGTGIRSQCGTQCGSFTNSLSQLGHIGAEMSQNRFVSSSPTVTEITPASSFRLSPRNSVLLAHSTVAGDVPQSASSTSAIPPTPVPSTLPFFSLSKFPTTFPHYTIPTFQDR